MIRDRLERIRERAFALWEGAGRTHGQDEAHWHQASSEVDAEDQPAPAAKRPAKAAAPAATAKAAAPKPAPKPAGKAKTAKPATKSAKVSSGGAGKAR